MKNWSKVTNTLQKPLQGPFCFRIVLWGVFAFDETISGLLSEANCDRKNQYPNIALTNCNRALELKLWESFFSFVFCFNLKGKKSIRWTCLLSQLSWHSLQPPLSSMLEVEELEEDEEDDHDNDEETKVKEKIEALWV